ncbi:MAG TPA: hypothetical protein VII56_13750 [Rhizomicrobium sp.]
MSEEGTQKKEKDFWDKLDVAGKLFSAVVIGLVTVILGVVYHYEEEASRKSRETIAIADRAAENTRADNQHMIDTDRASEEVKYNLKTQRLSVVTQLIPLIKAGGSDKKAAFVLMSNYADPEVASQLSDIYPEDMEITIAVDRTIARPDITAPAVHQGDGKRYDGWIYLGTYDDRQKKWVTKYLDFAEATLPTALEGNSYAVPRSTGAVNLRTDLPNFFGHFGDVLKALQPGVNVKIINVKKYNSAGFWWAQVEART